MIHLKVHYDGSVQTAALDDSMSVARQQAQRVFDAFHSNTRQVRVEIFQLPHCEPIEVFEADGIVYYGIVSMPKADYSAVDNVLKSVFPKKA